MRVCEQRWRWGGVVGWGRVGARRGGVKWGGGGGGGGVCSGGVWVWGVVGSNHRCTYFIVGLN